jgi:hypothetical protein
MRFICKLTLIALAIGSAGCSPFGAAPARSLATAGTGNGDAGGTWTPHFRVVAQPWRFSFAIDCRHARHFSFDVTLEQMHQNDYYDAVPLSLGWSAGHGPASATATPRIARSGEFWFIIRASSGCRWRVRAPLR